MKEGWEYKKLGEVADVIHGKNQKEVLSVNGTYPIYGSGGNIMGYATDYLCEAGTTILGRKGSINNPLYITKRFWNVDTAFGISAKEGFNGKFLFYFITTVDWLKKNTGTTLPSLTQQVVKSVILPVPPLSEQQSIVDYLDSAFAKIDTMKANAEKALNEAKALFQASLKKMLEPKEGWEEKTIEYFAKIVHGKNQKDVLDNNGIYPIYGSGGNIMGYANSYLCDAGTTILGRKGTIDNPFFIDEKFWNVDTAFGLIAKENCNKKYLYYSIKKVDWTKRNTGTTLPSLTQNVVYNVKMCAPSLSEQQSIVTTLDSLKSKVDRLQKNFDKISQECDALKQAILRQVFE
jgi:type I restriction enzyme S subunit